LSWTSTIHAIAGIVPIASPRTSPTPYSTWATPIRRRINRPTSGPVPSRTSSARSAYVQIRNSTTPDRKMFSQYSPSASLRSMFSASSDVVNGNRAMTARNRSSSQARSRLPLSMYESCVCCPFQKIPSVRKLSR
jgi:hypothetical protein